MTKKILFLFLLFLSKISFSQINGLNSIFNQPNYTFYSPDSNNYLLDAANSYNTLTKQIDSLCPFYTNEFYNNINNIVVDTTLYLMYGLHNQVPNHDSLYTECNFKFNCNNKESRWYGFYKKSTADTTNAFLFIPGSGAFQSLQIAEGTPTNYHNLNGNTRTKCLQYGDFYVYNKINEEFRSFWRVNSNNAYKRLDYDYLTSFSDLNGKHWAANMYIELVAAIKTLKKKYKNVFVMGLSSGGFPALLCGILGNADGINCAAGISSWSYNGFQTPTLDQPYFSNLLNYYTFDSLHTLINNSQSRILFSYGSNDYGGNAFENATHSIEDSINSPCNTDYFYNFYGHCFPTVYYDTFFNKVIKTPKVTLTDLNQYSCHSDSMKLQLTFSGIPPFTFQLYRNDTLIQNLVSSSNASILNLTIDGTYYLKNVIDVNNIPLCKSESFKFKKTKKLNYLLFQNGYLCSENKDSITINANGEFPLSINILQNGTPNTISLTDSSVGIKIDTGEFILQSINDNSNCILLINDTINTNIAPLSAIITNNYFDCFSNSNKVNFAITGKPPFTINYIKNGINFTSISNNFNPSLSLLNGSYYFTTITDSNNCSTQLYQLFNFNYQPISITASTPTYNCDSNKTKIDYTLQGNSPFTINYAKDANPLQHTVSTFATSKFYENGNYSFQNVTDATGCVANLNQNNTFNFDTIGFQLSTPTYNCDSNKTFIHIDLQGNAPWTIQYTFNGSAAQIYTANPFLDAYAANGMYQFLSVSDATGCSKQINQVYNFNYHPIVVTTSTPIYHCDSNKTKIDFTFQGNSPFVVNYTKDASSLQFATNSITLSQYFSNGTYNYQTATDATGCTAIINKNYIFNYDTIDIAISSPVYNCDSNKSHIHFDLQGNGPWTLEYTFNGIPAQILSTSPVIDAYAVNGMYQFLSISDATGCSKQINQVYNFNYLPLTYTAGQQQYDCDSNKYKIDFSFTGNPPWTIQYQLAGGQTFFKTTNYPTTSLWLANGNWIVDLVTDASNCIATINMPLSVNYQAIDGSISYQQYDCDSNKMRIDFSLQGNAPWTISYINSAIGIPQTVTSLYSNPSLFLGNGIFQFLQVTDNTQCTKNLNQLVTNLYTPLSIQKTSISYQCDSNKLKIDYSLNGDGPWHIQYKNLGTNLVSQHIAYNSTTSIYLPTGNYLVESVSDAKCTEIIHDTIHVNFPQLNALLTPFSIHCDSAFYTGNLFVTSGIKPYSLEYTYNNQPYTLYSNQLSKAFNLVNGTYYFNKIKDSVGCEIPINKSFTANYHSFNFVHAASSYNCLTDSSKIDIEVASQNPLWLVYSKNAQANDTLLMPTINQSIITKNNEYNLLYLYDSEGCVDSVNMKFAIDESPINVTVDSIKANCNEKEYELTINSEGKAPWMLYYNFNNIQDSLKLSNVSQTWKVPSGQYYFVRATDANECDIDIRKNEILYPFTPFNVIIQTDFKYVYTTATPLKYEWFYNGVKFDSLHNSKVEVQGEGEYYVLVSDSAGCVYQSNTLLIDFPSNINLYPNPTSGNSNILINEAFGDYWKYKIIDVAGNVVGLGTVHDNYVELKTNHLASGIYSVMIEYASESGIVKKVVRLMKN